MIDNQAYGSIFFKYERIVKRGEKVLKSIKMPPKYFATVNRPADCSLYQFRTLLLKNVHR